MPRPLRWPFRAALLAALLLSLAIVGGACGGGSKGSTNDSAAVEAAVRSFFENYNAKNVDGVLALLSDKLLQEQLGVTRDNAAETLAQFVGDPPQELTSIENIQVDGDNATADATYTQGAVLLLEQEVLVRQDGRWMFDDFVPLDTPIPAGTKTVDVTLTEYQFQFDKSKIPSDAPFAFKIKNAGEAEHELDLEKVPADASIEEMLQSQTTPPDVENVTAVGPFQPGDENTIVFAEPLPPGRYVMFSFTQDDDGNADALKGMTAEFTVE